MLVFLRERNELTQKQFAEAAGYSERLISKAEAGQPISTNVIDDLAEALSTDADPVFPEDLITNPVKHAKEYIAAVYSEGEGVVDAIAHFLDENIVFRVTGDPAQIPFAGEHHGIEGMRRMFSIFFSILEAPQGHNHEQHYNFIAQGKEVIMTGESWIHPIGLPMENLIRLAHRFVFHRGCLLYTSPSPRDS